MTEPEGQSALFSPWEQEELGKSPSAWSDWRHKQGIFKKKEQSCSYTQPSFEKSAYFFSDYICLLSEDTCLTCCVNTTRGPVVQLHLCSLFPKHCHNSTFLLVPPRSPNTNSDKQPDVVSTQHSWRSALVFLLNKCYCRKRTTLMQKQKTCFSHFKLRHCTYILKT